MRFQGFLLLVSLFSVVMGLAQQNGAGGATTTSVSATTVWITVTTNGGLATVKSLYKQSFMKTYGEADVLAPPSGAVGLGSITGSVGEVRSYDRTTVSNSNAAVGIFKPANAYAGLLGTLFLAVGFLL